MPITVHIHFSYECPYFGWCVEYAPTTLTYTLLPYTTRNFSLILFLKGNSISIQLSLYFFKC
jgi:hypothetical protein